MTREEAIEDMARAIFSIAADDDDYKWEDYRDVAAVALDGVRPWVDAQIAAERERADRAEADCNGLSLDVQALIAERDAAEARAEAAQDECEYAQDLVIRQRNLLTGVVNALRGPPPADTLWSHHDAPELAAALRASVREMSRAAEALKRECGMDPESSQARRNLEYQGVADIGWRAIGVLPDYTAAREGRG